MKQKKSKKWLTFGLAGATAVAAIALALNATLAARSFKETYPCPNPSFYPLNVGNPIPHAMRGATNISPSGQIQVLSSDTAALPVARTKAAGVGKLSLQSKKFTWEQDIQVIDPDLISGVSFAQDLKGYAPKAASSYQIEYGVYDFDGTNVSKSPLDQEKISWSSASPLIDSIRSTGEVALQGPGIATILGTFLDCWGEEHTLEFQLHVGDTSGRLDLNALETAIAHAELELAKTGTYTEESLDLWEQKIDEAHALLNQPDPDSDAVAAATQEIADSSKILVERQFPFDPSAFSFIMDTRITPDNPVFGSSALEVILQIAPHADNDYQIDWGDGLTTLNTPSHTYAVGNEYTIQLSGAVPGGIIFGPKVYPWQGENRLIHLLSALPTVQGTAVESVCYYCPNVKTIPSTLFSRNPQAVYMSYLFTDCRNLESIPEKLFAYTPNVTYLETIFYGCTKITSIPEKLFEKNPRVKSFTQAFSGCYGLSDANAIPENLFAKNTEVVSFLQTFSSCKDLTTIPPNLFQSNTKVTNFSAVFYNNGSLLAIPEHLFDTNTAAERFDYAFGYGKQITSIPEDLFAHNQNVKSFEQTFRNCEAFRGTLPELWVDETQKFPILETKSSCFDGCTGADNWNEVPGDWK